MTLRVLLVTSEFPPDVGGIGSHVAELAKGLLGRVDSVTVVHPQSFGSSRPRTELQGFGIERPRLIKGEPFYGAMLHRWLAKRRASFDLVHVHGVRPLSATRRLGVPTVFTNHSSGFLERLKASPERQNRTAALMQHIASLIAPSDELVEAARTLGYRGPAVMIPNGVDPARFSPGPSPIRGKLGIGADETVILLARRLVEKNGVVWFARALGPLKDRSFRVVVAGEGAERTAMEAILSENGMLERTIFLGSVANTDMPDLYRAADLSVLPSLAEATSIAGLEAMACALPLVGTNVGGIPTILEDKMTGLLVPPREPEAMARALGALISDADLRRRLGAAARTKVEREFTWPVIVRKTVDVYRATLARAA
ncbi:MAG TPA: glycosyltransferase family 4 protein [Rhizomicrobium sp.]|nr:glycosyltransferase family 4 protein [Rhizomicrobium sp.]